MPLSIFVYGDCFHKASISKADPPDPYAAVVVATNCAFACELYLKCLIHIETGQLIKKLHNLKQLFAMLPDATKATIQNRFDAQLAKQPDYDNSVAPDDASRQMAREAAEKRSKNLIDALRRGAEAFVEWRYLYENDGKGNPFGLFPLPPILRTVILEHKPEWANVVLKATGVGNALPTSPAR